MQLFVTQTIKKCILYLFYYIYNIFIIHLKELCLHEIKNTMLNTFPWNPLIPILYIRLKMKYHKKITPQTSNRIHRRYYTFKHDSQILIYLILTFQILVYFYGSVLSQYDNMPMGILQPLLVRPSESKLTERSELLWRFTLRLLDRQRKSQPIGVQHAAFPIFIRQTEHCGVVPVVLGVLYNISAASNIRRTVSHETPRQIRLNETDLCNNRSVPCRSQKHPITRLFTCSLLLEFIGLCLIVVHVVKFAFDGVGFVNLQIAGDILDILSRVSVCRFCFLVFFFVRFLKCFVFLDCFHVAASIACEGVGRYTYWADLEARRVRNMVVLWSDTHFALHLEYGIVTFLNTYVKLFGLEFARRFRVIKKL